MNRIIRLLTPAVCLAIAVCSTSAAPNTDVVRAYRVLAPDYSRTTGGTSPALSLDGDTLAYISHESQVWIIHGLTGYPEKMPEMWRLHVDICGSFGGSPDQFPPRNLDWSPDGKRLAIAFTSGSVYIAEDFDFGNQTANVRQLGSDPRSDDGQLHSPRWSPDGTKLVVARRFMHPPVRPYGVACIIDAQSGGETILSKDAAWGGEVWEQPWAPDCKSIVYASADSGEPGESVKYNIVIVSIDGKSRRQITTDKKSNCPSWAPHSDQIAFCSHRETKIEYPRMRYNVGYSTPAVWLTDRHGSAPILASPVRLPTKEHMAAASQTLRGLITRDFETNYGSVLTLQQRKLLESGEITLDQMQDIALEAEAKVIGGELQKLVDVYLRTSEPERRSALFGEALALLPEDARFRISSRIAGMSSEEARIAAFKPLIESDVPVDRLPVWSPDGKTLVFVRERMQQDHECLYVMDVPSGESRVAFTSGEISNVSWVKSSDSIVLVSKRLMSLHPKPAEPGEPLGYEGLVTKPGYPEVWELELKPSAADRNTLSDYWPNRVNLVQWNSSSLSIQPSVKETKNAVPQSILPH